MTGRQAPDRPWTTLVDATTLRDALSDPLIVLLDCRHRLDDPEAGPRAYEDGHIPGAHHAHIDRDLSGPVGARTGRHPLPTPERLRATFSRFGIAPETQVVSYDDAGGAWAARAWWLLRHYGHRAVAVLDGGLAGWREAGGALTDAPTPDVEDVEFVGNPGHLPTIDAPSIAARLPAAPGTLIDARDAVRYRGEVEPIDPKAGHIPGAASRPFKENLDDQGRFLAPERLRRELETVLAGRRPDEAAVYCGSGVTAAHDLLAFEIAGLPGAALYPGSWSEWCSDPDRPVATGPGRVASSER